MNDEWDAAHEGIRQFISEGEAGDLRRRFREKQSRVALDSSWLPPTASVKR